MLAPTEQTSPSGNSATPTNDTSINPPAFLDLADSVQRLVPPAAPPLPVARTRLGTFLATLIDSINTGDISTTGLGPLGFFSGNFFFFFRSLVFWQRHACEPHPWTICPKQRPCPLPTTPTPLSPMWKSLKSASMSRQRHCWRLAPPTTLPGHGSVFQRLPHSRRTRPASPYAAQPTPHTRRHGKCQNVCRCASAQPPQRTKPPPEGLWRYEVVWNG